MKDKILSIKYSSSLEGLTELNSSFDRGILRVAYTGRNPNNSFISKDTFEKCIPSIYNCPIVCNYDRDADDFGGHDVELSRGADGLKLINLTQPVGVIPESAEYWWQEIEDSRGIHEYLCVDALLWKRQEAYEKIKQDGITDESMEIKVKSGRMVDGCYHISDFEFTAFCLLDTYVNPCFESASLHMFSSDVFKSQFALMMKDFKTCFAAVGGDTETDTPEDVRPEGGKTDLNDNKEPGKDFALSGEQFREELVSALSVETVEMSWGTSSRYMYVDYSGELSEVFCYDISDWKLYGFTYCTDGDAVKIDFGCKKRKKFSIIDFDEGTGQDFSLEPIFSLAARDALFKKEQELTEGFESEKQDMGAKYSALEAEAKELRQFKAEALGSQRDLAEAEVFDKFQDLDGNEAFEELRGDCASLEIEEIEERCYALRGRFSNFSAAKPKTPKLPVTPNPQANEPYGGLFAKYGKNKD